MSSAISGATGGGHTLVVRPDNNGDVLLVGPALRAVASRARRVTLWVGPRGRAAASLLPGVDEVVCRELPWIDLAPQAVDRSWLDDTIDFVRDLGADRAIVCTSFHQSPLPTALILRAAGVGFVAATSVDYPGSLLDIRHRISNGVHEVERSLALVRAAGYELPAGDDGRLQVVGWEDVPNPLSSPGPYVVLHPGATAPARTLPPERLRQAVAALRGAGWHVTVTGGPGEVELTRGVAGDLWPGVTDLGGRTDWRQLARLLADADALVAGNTGPVHLAAAVGTPVVEVFAPVVPAVRWHPWQVPHVLLGEQGIDCAGCRALRCPYADQPCVRDVHAEDIVTAVTALAGPVRHQAEVAP